MRQRSLVFTILWSFCASFIIARTVAYLALIGITPDIYLHLEGNHLHHFNYGILALIIAGFASITNSIIPKKIQAIIFGLGLGLVVDEIGLLVSLQDDYWTRQVFDVAVFVTALLISIEYFSDFWIRIFKKLTLNKTRTNLTLPQKWPKISVVIPAYNEEESIAETLESLQKQNYQGKYEVIVVDNTSIDNTAKIAKKYGAKVFYEARKGESYAKQLGFEKASGEFIATTDADTILPSDWLKQMAQKLIQEKDLVAIGGWFKIKEGRLIPRLILNYLSPTATILYRSIFGKEILYDPNFMVKRKALLAVGGYRNLDSMHEDLVFANKLANIGKVKFFSNSKWAVVTSSRRWHKNFAKTLIPYIVNPIAFALFNKLPYKNYQDVREEKFVASKPNLFFVSLSIIILVVIGLAIIPANPVHAEAKEDIQGFFTRIHHITHQKIYKVSQIHK